MDSPLLLRPWIGYGILFVFFLFLHLLHFEASSTSFLPIRFDWFLKARKFQKTPYDQILRVRIQKKQAELDDIRSRVNFGPAPQSLPVWSLEDFEKKVAEGGALLIIDNMVHDIGSFYDEVSLKFTSLFVLFCMPNPLPSSPFFLVLSLLDLSIAPWWR